MLDLDMTKEALDLIELLRTTVWGRTEAKERCIRTLEREIALINGKKFPPLALPWLVAAGDGNESEVFWEIGAELDDDGTIHCFGRDFPSLDRRFDIEILGGAESTRLSRLSLAATAAGRGKWKGKLPFSTGFLQVALHENTSRVGLLAPVTLLPVHNSPNLIRKDSVQTSIRQFLERSRPHLTGPLKDVIDGYMELRNVGPCPGHQTIRVTLNAGQGVITGEPVRIEQGKSYYQSGWLRVRKLFENGNHWAELGRNYLDKDGVVLATTVMRHAYEEQRWSLFGQCLLTSAQDVPASDGIPEGTVFIQPFITVNGTCEIGLLYLGEASAFAVDHK